MVVYCCCSKNSTTVREKDVKSFEYFLLLFITCTKYYTVCLSLPVKHVSPVRLCIENKMQKITLKYSDVINFFTRSSSSDTCSVSGHLETVKVFWFY